MNDHFRVPSDDFPNDPVDRAIAAATLEPMPRESLERTIQTAASWETLCAAQPSWFRRRSSRRWIAAAAASAVAVAAIGFFILRRPDANREPSAVAAASPRPTHSFYEPGPATNPIVANVAPIFVAIGPEKPVRLGQKVLHQDIRGGLPDGASRLHVWDWSESDLSRVVLAPKSHRWSAVSPSGTLLLDTTGKAVDLVTGRPRQFAGLVVGEEQRVQRLWFSPTGRYVAALIRVASHTDQVQIQPPLYAATHEWALRILEPATGNIVSEFPAAGIAGPSFTSDESSIIYARPTNQARQDVVVRRDLKTGQTMCEYVPVDAHQVHEPVGIAISDDGKFVAVAYYYGRIFIWETASAKPVSHHDVLRADGTRDTFFQASIMRFSPDGELLAAACNNRLIILETRTGAIRAQHFDAASPSYAHLRWSEDSQTITLLARATIGEFADRRSFPARPTADIFPRVYEWDWNSGPPLLKAFLPTR